MGKHKKRRRQQSSSSSSSTEEDQRKRRRGHSKKSKHRHSKRSRRESSERSSDNMAQRSKEPEHGVVVRPPPDDSSPRGRTHGEPIHDTIHKSDGEVSPGPSEDETLNEILGLMPRKSIEPAEIDGHISARWGNIVTIGLTAELREDLLRNYPTPINCPMLTVPKLNPEIDISLSEGLRKKEEGFTALQRQLSAGLSALGTGLSKALPLRGQNAALVDPWLKNISDAGRILADLHHEVSMTRQKIVMPVIANPGIRKLAESSGVDKLLFGGDLSEKIKATKELEKSSHELKGREAMAKPKKFTPVSKSDLRNRVPFYKNHLNSIRPSRHHLQKKTESGGRYYNRSGNHRQRK